MKIIQIMDSLGVAGGVENFVYDLCCSLKDIGCDVALVGILDSKKSSELDILRSKGITVKCLGARNKKDAIFHYIGKLRETVKELSNNEPTICNLHLKLSVLLGVLATRGLSNIKCVETYHSNYSNYWLENRVLSPFISMYIPCSKTAKDEFIRRFRTADNKVTAIPNGIDRVNLRKRAVKTCSNAKIEFVSVGRFSREKNLHVTVKAFSQIKNREFVYKIYGDGELKDMIVAAAGNNPNIIMCGMVPRQQIINQLANASLVVMPSLWEGLSVFLLEAMAFDCPMMISDIASLRDVFKESALQKGEAFRVCAWGYLVRTSDFQAYKDAAEHFLLHQELWNGMKSAVRKISEQYTIQENAKCYKALYKRILTQE